MIHQTQSFRRRSADRRGGSIAGRVPGGQLLSILLLAGIVTAAAAADVPPLPQELPGEAPGAVTVRTSAPDAMWTDLGDALSAKSLAATDREVLPRTYRAARLDYGAMTALLATAPAAGDAGPGGGVAITLPLPDGSYQRFRAVETRILGEQVQSLIPEFRSYTARGIDDPAAIIHLDTGSLGLRAYGRTSQGTLWIDPWQPGARSDYISAWQHDFDPSQDPLNCGVDDKAPDVQLDSAAALPVSGDNLHTFSMALTLTGEYTTYFGGQTPAVNQAATTVNRINQVYETDVAVSFRLDWVLAYTDPGTDPFPTGGTIDGSILALNQSALDSAFGAGAYDIGHILTQGNGGGLAGLAVVCTASKAWGGTGRPVPNGDPFDIDYVAHEVGHQMGASHTFNGTTGGCSGNRSAANAYEPGSGSTIMAYAGICGAENLQPNSDPYFHVRSLEQIIATRDAAACAEVTPTGNTPPVAYAGPDWTIPSGTAFWMVGSGTDIDGDALTYCWEEYDLGPASPPTDPDGPLFRSFNPGGGNYRYFPDFSQALSGSSDPFEVLPTVDRSLTLRLTVRDNAAAGGGVHDDEVELTVSGAPFAVTYPNGGESFVSGQPVTVTWDVGGSIAENVVIWVLTSSGFTTLINPTPNDGSEAITLPCGITDSNCRIWIEELKGEYLGVHVFDVSDATFTLTAALPNYAKVIPPGWPEGLLVNDANTAAEPISLTGDATCFARWSYGNYGSGWNCAPFVADLWIDEVQARHVEVATARGPLTGVALPTTQPYVSGGRHTVSMRLDPDNAIPETNDANNDFARQWVWEGIDLAPETTQLRSQPPDRTAGTAYIPGGTTWYQNLDGVSLAAAGTGWQVVAAGALDGSDYDVYLFDQSSGATSGYDNAVVTSEFGGAASDFVVINRYVDPASMYDAGLLRYVGSGDYVVDRRYSDAGLGLETAIAGIPFAGNQLVDIHDLYVAPGQEGRNVIQVENVSTSQLVQVLLFDAVLGVGQRLLALATVNVGADGSAVLDYDFAAAGHYGLVVVREALGGTAPFTYDLRFRPTPPDIAMALLPGSYAPVVPQVNAPIPVGDPVPAPATLQGDAASTVLYFHVANNGPADAALWDLASLRDGVTIGSLEWPFGLPGGTTDIVSQAYGPFLIPGGRHTTGLFYDSLDEFDEVYENNNRYAEQWVWNPTQLAVGQMALRAAPPDPMGGWEDIPVGLTHEPNADGLRTPAYSSSGDNGFVGGWAAAPNPGSDIDLRVHAASTGAQDGFDTVLETSAQAGNATEFVLFDLDGPLPDGTAYDIGAVRVSGTTGYQAHATESQYLYYSSDGATSQLFGSFLLNTGELLGLFEFSSGNVAGTDVPLDIHLLNESGNANLALAVFGRTDSSGFYGPTEALPGGFADDGGDGADESVQLTFLPSRFWMVAVYKTDGAQTDKPVQFSLRFTDLGVVAVPEPVNLVAGISNYPNPFNPRTKIDFVLEQDGPARVRIFDVQGRLVRSLVDESLAAGAHSRVWRGETDDGRFVASGVYFAMFEHPGGTARQRMVLLK